ncbi:hypothetical protein ACI65C_013686 [Semiaphis heraclei]
MAYSVVHFFVDESVEAVPSFWVKGKTCAWPKNKIYAKKYIKTKRIPSYTDFQFLKARELCRGLKSLNEAKDKANIARYKSDFTDDDDVYFNQNCNEPNSPRSVSSMPIFSSPESDKGNNSSKKCESALKIKRNKPQSCWSPSPKKFKSLKNDHAGNSLPLAKKSQTVRQLAFSKGHSTTTPVQKVELIKDLRPLKEISTPEICFDRSKKLVTPSNDVNINIDAINKQLKFKNISQHEIEDTIKINMDSTLYSVVYFNDDNTVECVPNSWIKNGTCAWPSKHINACKMIEQNCTPNKREFNFYKIRELCSNIKAQFKARKAQFTSDLSDNDYSKKKKLKRKIPNSTEIWYNRQKRNAAEEKLLPISGLSNIKELRSKIRSIRGTYNQELGKNKNSMRTGSGAADIYKPKLNWFSYADSFLRKNVEQEIETKSNVLLHDETSADEASQIVSDKEDEYNKQTQEQDIPLHTQTKKRVLQKRNNWNKLQKIDNSLDDAVRALREVSSSSRSTNNEFTLFGQLVATQLAQLPLEEAINLQQEFQIKISEARLKHISSSSTTPSFSSPSTVGLSLNSSKSSYKAIPHEPEYEEVSFNEIIIEQPSLTNYYANWENV